MDGSLKIAKNRKTQAGQTLVETLVAIFVLITAVFTALALAVQSAQVNDNASKQITGTSLAREGVEAVKNVRDTNWIKERVEIDRQRREFTECNYFIITESGSAQPCYVDWLKNPSVVLPDPPEDLGYNDPGINYAVDFKPNTGLWVFKKEGIDTDYAPNLYYCDSTGHYAIYIAMQCASDPSPTPFSRKVNIKYDRNPPFAGDPDHPVKVIVTSTVWWTNRQCPQTDVPESPNFPQSCKVVLELHLTNWRNF